MYSLPSFLQFSNSKNKEKELLLKEIETFKEVSNV